MTNIKTGIFALATLFGIGSAFTTAPKTPVKTGSVYYSITDSHGGYQWTLDRGPLSCQANSAAPFCTIVTVGGFVPTANQVPPASTSFGASQRLDPGKMNQ